VPGHRGDREWPNERRSNAPRTTSASCAVYPDAANPFIHPELFTDEGFETWRVNEVWIMGSPRVTTYIDVTDTFEAKIAALRAHASQTSQMPDLAGRLRCELTENARAAGLPDGRLAELFAVFHTGRR